MIRTQICGGVLALLAITLTWQADGAGKIGKSDTKVKASATATKLGADGKQTVTITLNIEKGWHIYANPIKHNNSFLEPTQTVVKITGKEKLKELKVQYPAGKTVTEDTEIFDTYEGVIKIHAEVVRVKGDAGPLQISIDVNACNKGTCLTPGTVKLTVP